MRKFLKFTLSLLAMLMVTLNANAWKFTLTSPEEGNVESLGYIALKAPAGTMFIDEMGAVPCMMQKNGEDLKTWNMADAFNMDGTVAGNPSDYATVEEPGTYTLVIPAGSFHIGGDANEAQTFTWTIKDPNDSGDPQPTGWSFTGVSPAEGEVESLLQIAFNEPAGTSFVDEFGSMPVNLVNESGDIVAVYNLSDNFAQQVAGSPSDFSEITTPGTYTMTIPAGTFHIGGVGNAEISATWTIKAEEGPVVSPYTLTYDKASELLKLVKEGTTSYGTTYVGTPTLEGYEGSINFFPTDSDGDLISDCIGSYLALAPGTYTLKVPAGTFIFDGVENEAFEVEITIAGGSQGGDYEFSGTPSHETVFKAGETTVDKNNIAFETEGVTIITVDGEFELGGSVTTIPFGYNTYGENELDWNNKCKFVVTAKKDINKVIFVPTASGKNAIQFATAEGGNGEYTNGVWEGKLAAGETLTLTQTGGTQIKEIYVCYNGDDFDPTGIIEEKGVITIQYPVENQLIEKQVDGGKFCTFTTNKEYAQVTIEVRNSNEAYDNLYKFPTRMVDNMGEKSDNLHVGENTVTAATPGGGAAGHGDDWFWFKGDSYTMIVKGYVNPWDTEFDAMAEVHFVGNGKEHAAESTVKLLNVTPATSIEAPAKIAMVNGIVTLEFDGAVETVTAITPGGQSDPTINYVATAKAGSDNKVWEINLGDRSGYASADTDGNPTLEVDVTATAADGIVVLSDTRADRGLELKYELVAGQSEPSKVVTLGSPVWSIEEGAEIEASTSSINIKFPNAQNVEANYTLEVSGTIGDKNMNLSNVSGTGTIANGADIAVSLAEDKGYNLLIGTITVKDGNGAVVYSTEQSNYQINFGTKAAQGAGEGDGTILGGAPVITADATGITINFPHADFSTVEDMGMEVNKVEITTADGNVYEKQYASFDLTNGLTITVPYAEACRWNSTWTEMIYMPAPVVGDELTVTIPAYNLTVYHDFNDYSFTKFGTAYQNEEGITGTAKVVGGSENPEPQPSVDNVVLYDYAANGASTTLVDKARTVTVNGVTLTATGSNSFTVPAEGGNFKGLRVGKYVTVDISAETEIKKIEFTTNGTIWNDEVTNLNAGAFSESTWTGNSKNVTFKTPNDQTISKIIVYFKEETPEPPVAGWSFTGVSPAEGEVESLLQIAFNEPAGTSFVDELGSMPVNLVNESGDIVAVYNLSDNFAQQVAGTPSDFTEITTPGTYTMTIPAGTFHINGVANAEFSATWTIAGSAPTPTKDYTVSYADGTLTVAWPEGTTIEAIDFFGNLHPQIEGYDGSIFAGKYDTTNKIDIFVTLAAGDYTLKFPAGDFTINNVPNAEFSETFTVGGGTQGGDHEFDGTPYHETIFKAGETTVDKNNIAFETEGVTITTEGNTIIEEDWQGNKTEKTVSVGYNTYEENEIDWFINTKLIFTAKQDINKIIFVPTASGKNAIQYASAEGGDGEYNNGVWEGKLAAGETLTLKSNDGSQIKEIYVCYNGDDFDPSTGADVKGVITIQYPVENQLIEKQVDGGKFCTFTTNKEYAQVTIEVRNSNEAYDNLYKFPTRMVDNMGEKSDNLHVGENTVTAATPGGGAAGHGDDWYWFKGDSYTMIVKGYVNPWDTEYDAIAEVHFVGDGKEHVAESIVKLLNISPASSIESPAKIDNKNGIVTLEFDGAVNKVTALTPGGQMDPTIYYTATPVAGSDNKVWQFPLGDLSGQASADTDGNPLIEIDITAEAEDGIVILSDERADRGLAVMYELVEGLAPSEVVTLGTPAWSIEEGAEIETATSSINIKFPNAQNVEGTYILEVAGTIATKDMSEMKFVSGIGTIAEGADIAVSLTEDKGYNIVIGSVVVKDTEGKVVYATESGNYQLNFGTAAGSEAEDILGEPTVSVEDNTLKIEFVAPEGVEGASLAAAGIKIEVNGTEYYAYMSETSSADGKIVVEVPFASTMHSVTFDPYEPKNGDVLNITIQEPEVYANYADGSWKNVWAGDDITCTYTIETATGINATVVLSNDAIYNLSGSKVKVAKGIVIKNGKKYMVK